MAYPCSFPHFRIKSIKGNNDFPLFVKEYSTLGGTTGKIVFSTIPCFFNSESCKLITLRDASGCVLCNSLGLFIPLLMSLIKQGFHLPPIASIVTTIPQFKSLGIFFSYILKHNKTK